MTRRRTVWTVAASVAVLLGAAALAAAVWVPNEAQLAQMAAGRLTQALGVPVTIGSLHWQLLPQPLVTMRDARTQQDPPVTIGQVTGWPRLGPLLLHRQISFRRVEATGVSLPQVSLRALSGAESRMDGSAGGWHAAPVAVERLEFHDLVWIGRRQIPLEFDGAIDFDAAWRPRHAEAERPGVTPPVKLVLDREGGEDRWRADTTVGGGTWNGTLALTQPSPGQMRLTGELAPKGIEVEQMLAAFKRKTVVRGRVSGSTTLEAEGQGIGALVQSLHTRTRFSLAPATLLHFDLDKAIRSVGKEHEGNTRLDSLSGQLDTQNAADGIVLRYTGLKAHSGVLTASGSATLAKRRVDALLAVDLVDGLVGVPLKITGPVTQPEVSVPAGAVAGAAVGTAVLPGVGTAIGARIGGMFGKLFGGGKDKAPPASASAPAPATRKPAPAR
ncbi:MAG: glycine zipper domain-containing protein [Pseudomonadota bacterium]